MSVNKLQIAFVLDDSLDRPDGVQQYVLTLGSWYAEQGHTVHYVCTNTKRDDLRHLHSLSSATPIRFNKNALSFARPIKHSSVKTFFTQNKIDLLLVQLPHNPIFAGRIIAGAPKETTVIGTFHVAPYGKAEHFAVNSLQYLYRQSRKKIEKLYAVSRIAQPYAEKTYKLPASVVPNPVNTAVFRPKKPSQSVDSGGLVDIRFIGRLVPRKGCRYLILALKELIAQKGITNFTVTIGGKGSQLNELKALVAQLDLQKYVRFAGFVPEPDKPKFLQEADLVVFPSTGGESFGIVLLEAMATGSVVLAGDNPGYRGVLRPKEALFDPTNITEFCDTLADFIQSSAKRRKVAKLQLAHVKQYDVSKVGIKILADYQKISS